VSKKINKSNSYISKFGVHWRIRGRQSYGATLCGSTNSVEGHKGGELCWSGNTTIHRSVGDDKSTLKGNGDGEVWVESYNKEKTCNPKQSYICGKRY
jgi:hypothetical protein